MRYVAWKDEGRFGPATLVDEEAYASWRAAAGLTPDHYGVPFGAKPDGMEPLGWMTRAAAARRARRLGLELRDS